MNKIYFFSIVLMMSTIGFAQNYSYSFSGSMQPEQITSFEKECAKFNQVKSVKIKYKPDSQKGEVIIVTKEIPKSQSRQGMVLFQPTDIKKFLISKGLSPMQFKELKK